MVAGVTDLSVYRTGGAMVTEVEERVASVADDTDALDEQYRRARAKVPHGDAFAEDEFVPAPALEQLAETLIERYDLAAQYFPVVVLWKRKGGTARGKAVFGKCTKLMGLSKHFAGNAQFAIWIAADHCAAYEVTNYQLEAILFHELLHIDAAVDDDGVTTPRLKDHDVDGFTRDIVEYGAWRPEYRKLAGVFEQAPLIPDGFLN